MSRLAQLETRSVPLKCRRYKGLAHPPLLGSVHDLPSARCPLRPQEGILPAACRGTCLASLLPVCLLVACQPAMAACDGCLTEPWQDSPMQHARQLNKATIPRLEQLKASSAPLKCKQYKGMANMPLLDSAAYTEHIPPPQPQEGLLPAACHGTCRRLGYKCVRFVLPVLGVPPASATFSPCTTPADGQ